MYWDAPTLSGLHSSAQNPNTAKCIDQVYGFAYKLQDSSIFWLDAFSHSRAPVPWLEVINRGGKHVQNKLKRTFQHSAVYRSHRWKCEHGRVLLGIDSIVKIKLLLVNLVGVILMLIRGARCVLIAIWLTAMWFIAIWFVVIWPIVHLLERGGLHLYDTRSSSRYIRCIRAYRPFHSHSL